MNVLSLFDGISCGMVALERANISVDKYVAYEIEPDAIKVSLDNYPEIQQKGDVFKAEYTEGEFGLLIGGSPCTHWSISRQGGWDRETTASGIGWELFMQYVRAYREAKPGYFLYENNFSMSDDIKEEITRQLGVQPLMIDSADFSAQMRKRYYWTNIPVKLDYTPSKLVIEDIMIEGDFPTRDFSKYAHTVKWNKDHTVCSFDTSGKGYYSQANRCRMPCVKSCTLPASGNDKNDIWVSKYKSRHMQPIEAERLQTLPDNYTSCLSSAVRRSEVSGNGWTVDVIAYILSFLPEEYKKGGKR